MTLHDLPLIVGNLALLVGSAISAAYMLTHKPGGRK